jgi:hypothetical protein
MQLHRNTNPFATQRDKLRALLFARIGQWVPLPDVQALGIAQHGVRITELREELEPQGYRIDNRLENGSDGIKRSWYCLTAGHPAREYVPHRRERKAHTPTAEPKPVEPGQDWYRVQTGRERPTSHPFARPFSPRRVAEDDCRQVKAPTLFDKAVR